MTAHGDMGAGGLTPEANCLAWQALRESSSSKSPTGRSSHSRPRGRGGIPTAVRSVAAPRSWVSDSSAGSGRHSTAVMCPLESRVVATSLRVDRSGTQVRVSGGHT